MTQRNTLQVVPVTKAEPSRHPDIIVLAVLQSGMTV
jgi:hypothetical protein